MFRRIVFAALFAPGLCFAQAEKFQTRSFKGKGGLTLPYRLFVPPNIVQGTPVRLILALHGSGERGSNNTSQVTANRLATMWVADSLQNKYPSLVVAPQCPNTDTWVDYYKPVDQVNIKPPLAKAMELLDSLAVEFTVDANRTYVVGLSMGGFASWDLLARHPGKFAAAIPICGAGDTTKAHLMKSTPLWVWHGDADNVVPVAGSRNMVAALMKAGTVPEPKYTELKGVGHDSWSPAFLNKDLPGWLLTQSKASTGIALQPRQGRPKRRGAGDASVTWNVSLDGRVQIAPARHAVSYPVDVKRGK